MGGDIERRIAAAVQWAEGPINQYGAPYMLVHWFNGLATMGTATLCVHHGLDVVSVLDLLPFVSSGGNAHLISESASCVAGAACINSLTLPARLYLMSLYAMPLFDALHSLHCQQFRRFRSWLRVHLRENPGARRRLTKRCPMNQSHTPKEK